MKKYIKPEIVFTLLMEDLSICAGSPTIEHNATHGNDGTDEHGNGDWYSQGQNPKYPVEDDLIGDKDAFSKGSSIWDDFGDE